MRDARKSQGTQYSWRRVVVVKILPHVNMKIEEHGLSLRATKWRGNL